MRTPDERSHGWRCSLVVSRRRADGGSERHCGRRDAPHFPSLSRVRATAASGHRVERSGAWPRFRSVRCATAAVRGATLPQAVGAVMRNRTAGRRGRGYAFAGRWQRGIQKAHSGADRHGDSGLRGGATFGRCGLPSHSLEFRLGGFHAARIGLRGFLGRGRGVMLMAMLLVLGVQGVQENNAGKNLIATAIASSSSLLVVASGFVAWAPTVIMLRGNCGRRTCRGNAGTTRWRSRAASSDSGDWSRSDDLLCWPLLGALSSAKWRCRCATAAHDWKPACCLLPRHTGARLRLASPPCVFEGGPPPGLAHLLQEGAQAQVRNRWIASAKSFALQRESSEFT